MIPIQSKAVEHCIKSITIRAVRVPMPKPHRTASGIITESPLILTDIVTDSGITGHSMIFTYTTAALQPTATLLNNLEPLLIGEVLAPLTIQQSLAQRFRLLGTQGLLGMALAALDMALWDALARVYQTSLVQLLGHQTRPIPVYAGVGYDGAQTCANVASEWINQGFRGVKAKIGYPTVQEDVAVVQAIRKAVGDEVAIMVDYNQSLTPAMAIERLRVLEHEGLAWVEEPTLAHDYVGHAQIAREIRTPIQCGENWWGILDMQHALDANASDFMMPDVMKIGGVTGWMKAAVLAEARSVPISSHLWPELSARLLCCSTTAHWLEYVDWWNPILHQPLSIENGMAMVDETLGSGIEWNEKAVNDCLV